MSLAACAPQPASRIVLIVIDTLRADHLGAYGYERPTSPRLDAWAESGRLFERALATSPWTLPSMGSIYTGLLPGRHAAGAVVRKDDGSKPHFVLDPKLLYVLAEGVRTLAEILSDEGYETAALISNPFLSPRYGVDRGFDTYDYVADTWTTSASAPIEFNHFQATEYQGLVWVIGAFETNTFPTEDPADDIWLFDPANDAWIQGPSIPLARRRGGAGLAMYGDKFYVVGGNTIGHDGGYVAWFDVFDPMTGTWTALADAPHARDHFHAGVIGDKLYAVGGRLSGGAGGTFAPLIPEVDVYDFLTDTWSTLPIASDLPTPRAASAVAVHGGKLMVIGGEGNGVAYDTVEALDPGSDTWESLEPLNFARHGTQAIVSGAGVYVTAGSPNQGGGNQRNMEVYDTDAPAGTAAVAGGLTAPATATVNGDLAETIPFDHTSGNEGVYVTSIVLSGTDAAEFAITSAPATPGLFSIGAHGDVVVEYSGVIENASANLDVTHSGGQLITIGLTGRPAPEPSVAAGLTTGLLALLGLHRRRMRRSGSSMS